MSTMTITSASSSTTSPSGVVATTDDAPTAPVLTIDDLAITYTRGQRRTRAVGGVSLHIAPGESLAVVGESGSGKSSIARAALGLLPSSTDITGQILLNGTDLRTARPAAARQLRGTRIGYVPQDPGSSLDPVRRILDQVSEPLRIHGIGDRAEREQRALQALADAGLPDPERLGRRFPHQLSGGQRQRVLIAAAIIAKPQLIIADEPTSALDVTVQRVVLDRLQELIASAGTALLMITHDLAVAAQRTDRVLAMRGGRIIEQGSSRQVLLEPREPYTRELVAAMPGRRASRGVPAGTPHAAGAPDPSDRKPSDQNLPDLNRPNRSADAPALAGRGLSRSFGRGSAAVQALREATFTLPRGGALGIVGESGSGKTTLARILLGLEKSDAGTVELDGSPLGKRDRAFRRRVQPVFQNPHTSFDPMRTVGWSVLEPVRGLSHMRSRAQQDRLLAQLFTDVGLDPELAARRPHELSGGQLQRAAIARALSVDPEILVCDEAVSALDVTVQAKVLDLLARLRRERSLTLLLITHDLAVVEETCPDVLVMQGGRIVESGATAAVFADPQHEVTRELIAAIPDPWAALP